MNKGEELDQFQLLEDKIDNLIRLMTALRKEKESLNEKMHIQEEKLINLTHELESFKVSRDMAKQKIVSLLEKIEQFDI